jgi:class 3 adenylate cyclase
MGDGMLAVFGAPESLENHADLALGAARAMLQHLPQVTTLPMGIGLHSGTVVAGCLGQDARLEFTVLGDTVNLAARLEAMTKTEGFSLLISRATYGQLRSPEELFSLGLRPIRGRDETVDAAGMKNGAVTSPIPIFAAKSADPAKPQCRLPGQSGAP